MVDMKSTKQLKMTSIGISKDAQVNEIGTPYLHKRNKVGLTTLGKSKVARAIVYDQHIIDKAYLKDLITDTQHNALNKYFELISKSGAFTSGVSSSSEKIFTSQYSPPSSKAVVLLKVQRFIVAECGQTVEKKLWKIMCDNPQSLNDIDVKVLVVSSDALLSYWFTGQQSPVSLFQQALTNPL